jgi:hypothetical protein
MDYGVKKGYQSRSDRILSLMPVERLILEFGREQIMLYRPEDWSLRFRYPVLVLFWGAIK